jgi:hypothetical protein
LNNALDEIATTNLLSNPLGIITLRGGTGSLYNTARARQQP